jgi:hypothetical protein
VDRPRWNRRVTRAIKLAVGALVLLAVGRHVDRTWRELHEQGRSIRVDASWLAAGVGLYLVGLCALAMFFARVVDTGANRVVGGYGPAVRAYLISHLGKYVPGKAMVVIMRVGLLAPYGARPATTALATAYETLVMMAAGGLIAALGYAAGSYPALPVSLGRLPTVAVSPTALSLALGVSLLVVVSPPVFPRLAGLVRLPMPSVGREDLPRASLGMLAEGLAWSTVGWVLLGLSQVAVLRALMPSGVAPGLWTQVVAGVALATVAGFVVPIAPGGLGVREWVLWTSLASAIDRRMAVVAALALRLTWVAGEVLAAAVLAAARPAATGHEPP